MAKHIKGTSYKLAGHTDLCMMSVPSLFIMGMHDAPLTSCVTDTVVKDALSANRDGHKNLIESVIKAYHNTANIAIIFNSIKTEQKKCISSFFSDNLYPASVLYLNITIANGLPSTIANFNAVPTNLGIHADPLGDITLPLHANTTVVIQKEDKAVLTTALSRTLLPPTSLLLSKEL